MEVERPNAAKNSFSGFDFGSMISGSRGGRNGKIDEPLLCRRGENVERKSIFGRYSEAEMLTQLKGLAMDPCNLEFALDKIQPLWNQTLRVRKVMALSDTAFPRRKRKLEQFCKDKLIAASGVAKDVSVRENDTKISRGQLSHTSSASCLLNSAESAESFDQKITLESCSSGSLLTFEDSFRDKQICLQSSFQDDASDCRSSTKYLVPLVDSDDSVNDSNPLTPENLNHQEAPSLELSDAVHITNSPNLNGEMQKNLHQPRRSIRILNFIGDHLERKVIPVGPRFQAVVPEWTGPIGKGNYDGDDSESEDSRWLGTRVWPVEGGSIKTTARIIGKGRPETTARTIGKARPDSCSCVSPGSIDCIKRHILEERLLLQCDLGPAFFSWKFDEMGEQALKSWTLKEQETFEALIKGNPQSNRKNFVKRALKSFPNKSTKTVVSYYFNVFIPRRISLRTRLSLTQVYSDEDEVDGYNYLNWGKRCGGRVAVGGPKGVKTLYLRRAS